MNIAFLILLSISVLTGCSKKETFYSPSVLSLETRSVEMPLAGSFQSTPINVVFLIDNSNSMERAQKELSEKLSAVIDQLPKELDARLFVYSSTEALAKNNLLPVEIDATQKVTLNVNLSVGDKGLVETQLAEKVIKTYAAGQAGDVLKELNVVTTPAKSLFNTSSGYLSLSPSMSELEKSQVKESLKAGLKLGATGSKSESTLCNFRRLLEDESPNSFLTRQGHTFVVMLTDADSSILGRNTNRCAKEVQFQLKKETVYRRWSIDMRYTAITMVAQYQKDQGAEFSDLGPIRLAISNCKNNPLCNDSALLDEQLPCTAGQLEAWKAKYEKAPYNYRIKAGSACQSQWAKGTIDLGFLTLASVPSSPCDSAVTVENTEYANLYEYMTAKFPLQLQVPGTCISKTTTPATIRYKGETSFGNLTPQSNDGQLIDDIVRQLDTKVGPGNYTFLGAVNDPSINPAALTNSGEAPSTNIIALLRKVTKSSLFSVFSETYSPLVESLQKSISFKAAYRYDLTNLHIQQREIGRGLDSSGESPETKVGARTISR